MKVETKNEVTKKHENTKLILTNKSQLNLTGVNKVYSCTETCVSLMLGNDDTLIEGSNLHVQKLYIDTGAVDIEGTVCAIKLGKGKNSKNLFKRIFS